MQNPFMICLPTCKALAYGIHVMQVDTPYMACLGMLVKNNYSRPVGHPVSSLWDSVRYSWVDMLYKCIFYNV